LKINDNRLGSVFRGNIGNIGNIRTLNYAFFEKIKNAIPQNAK
jgi:hypothetical protein